MTQPPSEQTNEPVEQEIPVPQDLRGYLVYDWETGDLSTFNNRKDAIDKALEIGKARYGSRVSVYNLCNVVKYEEPTIKTVFNY